MVGKHDRFTSFRRSLRTSSLSRASIIEEPSWACSRASSIAGRRRCGALHLNSFERWSHLANPRLRDQLVRDGHRPCAGPVCFEPACPCVRNLREHQVDLPAARTTAALFLQSTALHLRQHARGALRNQNKVGPGAGQLRNDRASAAINNDRVPTGKTSAVRVCRVTF